MTDRTFTIRWQRTGVEGPDAAVNECTGLTPRTAIARLIGALRTTQSPLIVHSISSEDGRPLDEPSPADIDRIVEDLTGRNLPWLDGDEDRATRFPYAVHARHRYDAGCSICRAADRPEALRTLIVAVLDAERGLRR